MDLNSLILDMLIKQITTTELAISAKVWSTFFLRI